MVARWSTRVIAAIAVVGLAAACEQSNLVSPPEDAPTFAADFVPSLDLNNEVWVCKDAPSGTFDFTVDVNGPVSTYLPDPSVTHGECVQVAAGGNGTNVTVTELPANGYTFDRIDAWRTESTTDNALVKEPTPIVGTPTITRTFGDFSWVFVFVNTENPPPPPALDGRMTGGGSVFLGDVRFTHGFELHCNVNDLPNNLEVNWPDNRFHLTSLTSVVCTDDPDLHPLPRKAGFDTYTATGEGLWNGQPGATIAFQFTDDGEPGKVDHATMTITPPGGSPVTVSGYLSKGNHQAHWVN